MKRVPIPTVVTAAVLVAALLVYWVTFQVRFNERAVRVQFGRAGVESVIAEPGLYFKWPPPIETVRTYDTRLRVLDTPETEVKTADGQNVIVGCYAVWRIKDPYHFFVRLTEERAADEQLRTRVNEIRARVFGQHSLSEFVNLDATVVDANYEKIHGEMLAGAAPGVLRDYGVELLQVGIRRISLPDSATEKVQEAMRQERESLASKFTQEGKSIAAAIKASAESYQKQILAFAERRASEIESEGVKATERIFAQIAPEDVPFFLYLRYVDALRASLRTKTTLFIDWNSDLFRYFEKPFDGRPADAPKPTPSAAAADRP